MESGADLPEGEKISPLDFMLGAVNNPQLDIKFRAQMAQAAAPYVHPRAGETPGGIKAARDARAKEVGAGPRFKSLAPPKLKSVK